MTVSEVSLVTLLTFPSASDSLPWCALPSYTIDKWQSSSNRLDEPRENPSHCLCLCWPHKYVHELSLSDLYLNRLLRMFLTSFSCRTDLLYSMASLKLENSLGNEHNNTIVLSSSLIFIPTPSILWRREMKFTIWLLMLASLSIRKVWKQCFKQNKFVTDRYVYSSSNFVKTLTVVFFDKTTNRHASLRYKWMIKRALLSISAHPWSALGNVTCPTQIYSLHNMVGYDRLDVNLPYYEAWRAI